MQHQEEFATSSASLDVAPNRSWYFRVKRILDIIFSIALILILAPAFLLIAVAIELDSRGPVLFRSIRIGQGGKPFFCYKFRTMSVDFNTETNSKSLRSSVDQSTPDKGEDNGPTFLLYKTIRDPRVTRVGYILRRTSLDEMPQVINILIGDMSLVGPRAALPYEVEYYQEWQKGRLKARPGLTGLWQVQGRGSVSFDEMVRMDLDYVTHMSLFLDLKILTLTPWSVLSGKDIA